MLRLQTALLLLVALLSPVEAAQPAAVADTYKLKVVTDRPEAIYKVGERAIFQVTLVKGEVPVEGVELTFRLSNDGYQVVEEGKVKSGSAAKVLGSLEKPGFLRINVEGKGSGTTTFSASAAAGFDPHEIKPSLPVPDDFDAFWDDQKKALAAVPLNPKLTPVKSVVPEAECFDVKIDCLGGKPVSGYFARPVNVPPKSLPAMLLVHGAGVRSSNLASAAYQAKRGRLAMDINAHGIANGEPNEFYEVLTRGELANYRHAGRENRDTVYFKGMFLRLIRALDFLCSQPEWDGKILIVSGGSQGGGQALAAAGLDSRVTAIYAGVPALCDHSGNAIGRIAGWPKLVPVGADKKPDAKILAAARYFDGMNFATRTKADAILSVGFVDGTCPPTAVYATFNNLSGTKKIITGPLSGHEGPSDAGKQVDSFLTDHIVRLQGK